MLIERQCLLQSLLSRQQHVDPNCVCTVYVLLQQCSCITT